MSKVLSHLDVNRLRKKQAAAWLASLEQTDMEKTEMRNPTTLRVQPEAPAAQEELDFDTATIEGESKNERFKRVVNPRLKVAVTRLRLIRQMFEGATVNNYEFTEDQRSKLVQSLRDEVDAIDKLMAKRLRTRDDDIPQL